VRAREAIAARRGEVPDIATVFFDYGVRDCFYDNAKAVRELGVKFRPIDDTIRDAVAWFRAHDMMPGGQ
jgi:dihydroflavonol-4-reductase